MQKITFWIYFLFWSKAST